MVFSDTTNKNGVIQECEDRCGLGDAGISGNSYLLKRFTAFANKASRIVWYIIFSAYGGWQYDDANQTDLPAATADLTASVTSYALPSGSLSVRGIEVKDQGGVWTQLKPATEEQIRELEAMGEFFKTASQPLYYQLVGQTVRIFPASNYTQSSSFKVFFDRGSVAFASTDTTKQPGFASEFHDIIPTGASLEWYEINSPNSPTTQQLRIDFEQRKNDLKGYFSQKFHQMFPPRFEAHDVLREYL